MKHPTREEWMSYLFDELNPAERAGAADHLRDCAECAAKVNDWQAARQQLAGWEIPLRRHTPARRRSVFARPAFQWAAAAVILLGGGFGAGRLVSTAAEANVRATIAPEVRRQVDAARAEWQGEFAAVLRQELDKSASATLAAAGDRTGEVLGDFAQTFAVKQAEENRAIYAALQKIEAQRATDYVLLKKDLDTVAVNTDAGLRHTEQQLIQLADAQPVRNSDSFQK